MQTFKSCEWHCTAHLGVPSFSSQCDDHRIADISGILGKMRDSLFNSDAVQPAKEVEVHQEALLGLKELVFMQISELQGSWVAVAGVSILAGATTMWSQSFTVGECPSSVSFLWQTFLYYSKCLCAPTTLIPFTSPVAHLPC